MSNAGMPKAAMVAVVALWRFSTMPDNPRDRLGAENGHLRNRDRTAGFHPKRNSFGAEAEARRGVMSGLSIRRIESPLVRWSLKVECDCLRHIDLGAVCLCLICGGRAVILITRRGIIPSIRSKWLDQRAGSHSRRPSMATPTSAERTAFSVDVL